MVNLSEFRDRQRLPIQIVLDIMGEGLSHSFHSNGATKRIFYTRKPG